jgi:hypothetical protein
MISISPKDIQVAKVDVTLAATVVIVSNLVSQQLLKTPSFNEQWKNMALATIIGFAVHALLTHNLSSMVSEQLNLDNEGMNKSVYDLFKFGTVFLSQKYIYGMLSNTPVVLDEKWMMESGLTIAGYSMFNVVVEKMMPQVGEHQALVNDLVKVSMGELLAKFIVDKAITQQHIMGLISTLAGFVAFHLVTKNFVVPKEKFTTQGGYSIQPK